MKTIPEQVKELKRRIESAENTKRRNKILMEELRDKLCSLQFSNNVAELEVKHCKTLLENYENIRSQQN